MVAHLRSSAIFRLRLLSSASYLRPTEWNVRDNDGTVIFTLAAELWQADA